MRIFISYRRADLGGHAEALVGRIFDRLSAHYGASNIFLDIDSIPIGRDFIDFIGNKVAQADVLLAIIGPSWAHEMKLRSGHEQDFVRVEIQSALERHLNVIPVLVGGASMPDASELPKALQEIEHKHGIAVNSGRDFHSHIIN